MKKVVIHPDYVFCSDFIDRLPDIFHAEGTTIFKARNEVKLFHIDNRAFVVKSFKIPHFINKIVYTHFRLSKAKRSYTNALLLLERAIETPHPVACMEVRRKGLLYESYYVSEKSPFNREFREICHSPATEEMESVLIDFAAFTASIHDKNVLHKDFTPGNILFGRKDNHYTFQLVDVNRMTFCPVSMKMGCKNFRDLYVTDAQFAVIARHYARARGFNPDCCEKFVLQYRLLPK